MAFAGNFNYLVSKEACARSRSSFGEQSVLQKHAPCRGNYIWYTRIWGFEAMHTQPICCKRNPKAVALVRSQYPRNSLSLLKFANEITVFRSDFKLKTKQHNGCCIRTLGILKKRGEVYRSSSPKKAPPSQKKQRYLKIKCRENILFFGEHIIKESQKVRKAFTLIIGAQKTNLGHFERESIPK